MTSDRLGHSKKGWITGEIGQLWMQDFDAKTQEKAAGRKRLLLVDGHSSHHTYGLLEYARREKIIVVCYPSHATHIYQGLDVVIFGPLKKSWSRERDRHERETGKKVSKQNFLSIYGAAHVRTLTPTNIRAAFAKTGVWPFNPNVITPAMMAPSRDTSEKAAMPLKQPTPIRIVADIFDNIARRQPSKAQLLSSSGLPISGSPLHNQLGGIPSTSTYTDLCMEDLPESESEITGVPRETTLDGIKIPSLLLHAFARLSQSSASYLVSNSPIEPNAKPPVLDPILISPVKPRHTDLLTRVPETETERLCQMALQDAEIREAVHKGMIRGQQAALVLQALYCTRVRRQLATREKKKIQKKNKLFGDGLPKLLTGDDFIKLVLENEEVTRQKEADKERRMKLKRKRVESMEVWKQDEDERVRRNKTLLEHWRLEITKWEAERDLARTEHRRPGWTKPLRPKLPKKQPKPKLSREISDNEEEIYIDTSDSDSHNID
jgi:hypothetical protein